MNHKQKQQVIRRGMRISTIDGLFSQLYAALCQIGSGFITKFMVILGASPLQFSLLSALGQVSALFQPLGLAFTHRLKSRKKACVWITASGRFLTLFMGAALLFSSASKGIWFMLALLFVSAGMQAIGANIWIAWISDLVPLSIRGSFFSRRNQILIVAGMAAGYIFSLFVDLFEAGGSFLRVMVEGSSRLSGFFVPGNQAIFLSFVFAFGTLMGLIGLSFLARQPERSIKATAHESLKDEYLSPFKDANFRKLLRFGIWWMLAIGVGSAFWGPFMLKKLGMGMFTMQLYGTMHSAASILSYSFWGRFIDKVGNKTAMKICVFMGGLNPMLWLFTSPGNYGILWLEAAISGTMWAGNSIVATNFVLAIAPKGKQQVYSGLYAAIAGVSMMFTTLLSGAFFPSSLDLGWKVLEPEQVIFGIGGILRWFTIIPLLAVHEQKTTPLRSYLQVRLKSAFSVASEYWQYLFKKM